MVASPVSAMVNKIRPQLEELVDVDAQWPCPCGKPMVEVLVSIDEWQQECERFQMQQKVVIPSVRVWQFRTAVPVLLLHLLLLLLLQIQTDRELATIINLHLRLPPSIHWDRVVLTLDRAVCPPVPPPIERSPQLHRCNSFLSHLLKFKLWSTHYVPLHRLAFAIKATITHTKF